MSLRPLRPKFFELSNQWLTVLSCPCCRRGLRGRHAAPAEIVVGSASPCRLAASRCHQQLGAPDDASSFGGSSQCTEMCTDRAQDSKSFAEDAKTITGTMGLHPWTSCSSIAGQSIRKARLLLGMRAENVLHAKGTCDRGSYSSSVKAAYYDEARGTEVASGAGPSTRRVCVVPSPRVS